jgi:radical SAM protein with 4Fe4S-binding SPASM domain
MRAGVRPKGAWMTVNRACNFRCSWCYAAGRKFSSRDCMPIDLARRLADIIAQAGLKHVTILGGEPTLWRHLMTLNSRLRALGLRTTLVSNGARFGDDRFWESYLEEPNDRVGLSVKAFDGASLARVARTRSFGQTAKGLKRAIDHFKCGVSVVYALPVIDDLREIVSFAIEECGAKSVSISPCTPTFSEGKADGKFIIEPSELVRRIVQLYPVLNEISGGRIAFSMKLPLCLWPEDFIEMLIARKQVVTICQLQQKAGLIFDTDGKAAMCNSLTDFSMGKLGIDFEDAAGLLRMLSRPEVVSAYRYLTSPPVEECLDCKLYSVCGGGCPLYWAVLNARDVVNPKLKGGE